MHFFGKPDAGSARRPSEARPLREDWADALRFGLPIRKETAWGKAPCEVANRDRDGENDSLVLFSWQK